MTQSRFGDDTPITVSMDLEMNAKIKTVETFAFVMPVFDQEHEIINGEHVELYIPTKSHAVQYAVMGWNYEEQTFEIVALFGSDDDAKKEAENYNEQAKIEFGVLVD